MCFLFNFSKYVSVPILSEWLSGVEVMLFDTALTNKTERNHFLQFVFLYPKLFQKLIFPLFSIANNTHCMIQWALSKGFDLKDLLKRKFECMKEITNLYIEHFGGGFNKVKAKDKNLVSRLLMCFPNVSTITLHDCRYFESVVKYCSKTEKLRIHISDAEGLTGFVYLGKLLRESKVLKHLSLNMGINAIECDIIFSSLVFSKLISTISFNQFLSYPISVRQQLQFYMHCKAPIEELSLESWQDLPLRTLLWYKGNHLRKLRICNTYLVTAAAIKEIPVACPNLTYLDIYCPLLKTEDLITLFQLHTLTALYIRHPIDESLEFFAALEGSNLKKLGVGFKFKFSTEFPSHLKFALLELSLYHISFFTEKYTLLINACSNLMYLALSGFCHIDYTDSIIASLPSRLITLNVMDYNPFTFAKLWSEENKCTTLNTLVVRSHQFLRTAIILPRKFEVIRVDYGEQYEE